jgi:hypothetical protein
MILEIDNPPTLHRPNREERARLVQVITDQLGGPLERKLWAVSFDLYGNWFDSTGKPRENNTDNCVKCLLDMIAEAGGLGKVGRGDCWLDRRIGRIWAYQAETARAVITLE